MFELFLFFSFPSLWKCSLRYHQPASHCPWRMTSFWPSSARRAFLVQMTVRTVSSGLTVRVKVTVSLDNASASSVDLCASSLAFRECLQMSSLMVLMKLVVCTRWQVLFGVTKLSCKHGFLGPVLCLCCLVQGAGLQNMLWGLWACLAWALWFVGLSHMGSGVCGPVSHGLWGLWGACLAWALRFVGLSCMGSEVCGPVLHGLWGLWACLTLVLGCMGLSRMGSVVCGPVSHGLWGLWAWSLMGSVVCGPVSYVLCGLWACLTWALGFVGLSHMGCGLWACLTWAVNLCVWQTKVIQWPVGSWKVVICWWYLQVLHLVIRWRTVLGCPLVCVVPCVWFIRW